MKRIKKILELFLCTLLLSSLIPMKVHADVGPKPSTVIEIEGLEDEVYYGTLLSQYKSNGPLSVMSESGLAAKQNDEDYEIWKAFAEYEDRDGYFFFRNSLSVGEQTVLIGPIIRHLPLRYCCIFRDMIPL